MSDSECILFKVLKIIIKNKKMKSYFTLKVIKNKEKKLLKYLIQFHDKFFVKITGRKIAKKHLH